jgi:hypothetical protein
VVEAVGELAVEEEVEAAAVVVGEAVRALVLGRAHSRWSLTPRP